MQGILIATLVVGVVGLVLGLALVTASKKFYVETDERVTQVRECLRGANCGACGYAGCDAVAEAIVKGEARVDACPGNSTENIARIAAILGKEAIDQDPQVPTSAARHLRGHQGQGELRRPAGLPRGRPLRRFGLHVL